MFNTFNVEHPESSFSKKEKALMKERIIELNNFSTIQLNPWNDDPSKSPIYEENDSFSSFIKPNFKNTNIIKYATPKQQFTRHENKIIIERKRIDSRNLVKRQSHLIRGRNKLLSENQELQKMNKTISVHNFEGEKMFNQHGSIQSREKVLDRQEKRHRTTINNPMYGKFCFHYNNFKKNPALRKKIMSEAPSVKFENTSIKQILNSRPKLWNLSIDRERGDPERAKSIHEVRRRLKSTSQIMKRKQQSLEIGAHEISEKQDNQEYGEGFEREQNKKMVELVSLTQQKGGKCYGEDEKLGGQEWGEKYKLGKRKNLYIGFRKFFNMGVGNRQKSRQMKQCIPGEIVNLSALMEQGQGQAIRKYEKFEEYAYQKSYNRNGN